MAKPDVVRDKVLEYFQGKILGYTADHFLRWLGSEGYQIVARRGTKKKPYTGPMTAGETHIGRMSR